MVLSITAAWIAEMTRGDVEPIFLIDIAARKISDGSSVTLKFSSGGRHLFDGYDPSLASVSGIGYELDPITRHFSIGDITLTFSDDDNLRTLLGTYYLRGKVVTIKLGSPNLAAGSFQTIAVHMIDTLSVQPGAISFQATDVGWLLRDRSVIGAWINRNPIQIIADIIARVDTPSAYYDSTSLNYADTAYDNAGGTSHLACSRYRPNPSGGALSGLLPITEIGSGVPAIDLVRDLVQLVYGSLIPKETDGKYYFSLYDANAAADRALDTDDVSGVEQFGTWENIYNSVEVNQGTKNIPTLAPGGGGFEHDSDATFRRDDSNSQNFYGIQGETYVSKLDVKTDWQNAISVLDVNFETSSTTISVKHAPQLGFSGTRHTFPSTVIATADAISADRPAYLLLYYANRSIVDVEFEIVKATSCTISSSAPATGGNAREWAYERAQDGTWTRVDYYSLAVYGGLSRAQFGTTTVKLFPNWQAGAARVLDITAAVRLTEVLLSRFANGAPRIRFRTNLRHFDLQVADVITVVDDQVLDHSLDGIGATNYFEITKKELDLAQDEPSIIWEACWMRNETAYNPTEVYTIVVVPFVFDKPEPIFDQNFTNVTDSTGKLLYAILGGQG